MPARILIIEDNPANLALAEYVLKVAGYTILTARDGGEGVRTARAERPDLVLCDLQMPVLDGYEVLRQLRADPELRHILVIAVTAFSMPGDDAKTLTAGFDGYLSKPIMPETFVRQIEVFLKSELRLSRPPAGP